MNILLDRLMYGTLLGSSFNLRDSNYSLLVQNVNLQLMLMLSAFLE